MAVTVAADRAVSQRSLSRFQIEEERAGHANPDLHLSIAVGERACKAISAAVGDAHTAIVAPTPA